MAEPYYTTAAALRTELGVTESVLPNDEAVRLIESAEDLIDADLGVRKVDPTTGRRVVESEVEAWQWAKLGRATAKLAAAIYRTPDLLAGPGWKSISGPDFSYSGPTGSRFGPTIGALLDQTGLRRLTTTMTRGRMWFRHGFPSNADPIYED